jgi:NAD(P)-dependent dehydrogenase (short-subunit alcohol dehydrogenase family)
MLKEGHGRIINLSSQASVVGIPRHAVYCASKGGVNQLTKVLALEWSARGVTVNAVGPTFIRTPGTAERLDNPKPAGRPRGRLVHIAIRVRTTGRKRSPTHACCKDGEKQRGKREFQRNLSLKRTSTARTPSASCPSAGAAWCW